MASQKSRSKTPLHIRNRLRTPQFVYEYLNTLLDLRFDVDLCADEKSALNRLYIDAETDALKVDWRTYGKSGFCNPPYDSQKAWIDKAISQYQNGFTTAMLIPCFNGQAYWKDIFINAHVMPIVGRLSFICPETFVKGDDIIFEGDPMPGNDSGSCIVVFNPPETNLPDYLVRDDMRKWWENYL